ncbi:MAG: hypothetical protein QXZ71_04005, partial [Candidatus Caldarchaeum sp.]
MAAFESLHVWKTPEIRERLDWYFQVSVNKLPAKYLLCRRVPIYDELDGLTEEELWRLHDKAASEFHRIRQGIREGSITFKELR